MFDGHYPILIHIITTIYDTPVRTVSTSTLFPAVRLRTNTVALLSASGSARRYGTFIHLSYTLSRFASNTVLSLWHCSPIKPITP